MHKPNNKHASRCCSIHLVKNDNMHVTFCFYRNAKGVIVVTVSPAADQTVAPTTSCNTTMWDSPVRLHLSPRLQLPIFSNLCNPTRHVFPPPSKRSGTSTSNAILPAAISAALPAYSTTSPRPTFSYFRVLALLATLKSPWPSAAANLLARFALGSYELIRPACT